MIEACQQRSYCWLAPGTWTDARGAGAAVGSPPGYSNHQYELTEPVSHSGSPELHGDAHAVAGAGMHRNPSILQTAMSSGGSTPGGSRTPRAMGGPNALRGPSLNPVRSPLASPSMIGSPIGSASPLSAGYRPGQDVKTDDYDLMMRGPAAPQLGPSPPTLSPPIRNPRRISPQPNNRVHSPMSPLSLDGIANASPLVSGVIEEPRSPPRPKRDEGPPQLGQLSFLDDDPTDNDRM